eukprot:TRINITY_DN3637_c0_g1_i3.p1 TRINITY_DN3637_c0_g1~~TRINITY_DN3637_c0_g1_i3.p1  ORF type:complete len:339 (-),score=108.96 TRINITY_DN3637_c0_g1_i3:38-1054(-)
MFGEVFTPKEVERIVPVMEKIGNTFIRRWTTEGTVVDVNTDVKSFTLHVIVRLMFGNVSESQIETLQTQFVPYLEGLFSPIAIDVGKYSAFGRALIAQKKIREVCNELALSRKSNPENDFLSKLVEISVRQPDLLPWDELLDNMSLFLFAGHDTSSGTLQWILYELATNPQVLSHAQAEIDTLGDEPLSAESFQKLPYLEAVIKETMRLHTVIGGGFRKVTQDFSMCGFNIEKDATVGYRLTALHNDPELFENPGAFVPERFLKENEKKLVASSFLPFSAGPRVCLGQDLARNELRVMTALLVRHCNFAVVAPKEPVVTYPIPFPVNFKLRLTRRVAA